MAKQWLRELDDVPPGVIDKLASVGIHSLRDFSVRFMDETEAKQLVDDSQITEQEFINLLHAIWAQVIGIKL